MKFTHALAFLLAGLGVGCSHVAPPGSVLPPDFQVPVDARLPAAAKAAQVGVKTCLPAIIEVKAWLARGQSENAVASWDEAAADKNLFSALLTLENKSSSSWVNLIAVPSSDGQCVVEYTQTGYVAQTCIEYLKSLGKAARYERDLNSKTALIRGQGVQILLSSAGEGCLWMRKELIKKPAATR